MTKDHILEALDKKKIDAVYGKKKYFNAADRQEKWHTSLIWLSIILSALTSASLLPQLKLLIENSINGVSSAFISFCLSLLLTLVLSIQKSFEFDKLSNKNAVIGNLYLRIYKDICDYIAFIEYNHSDRQDIYKSLLAFQNRLDDANQQAIGSKVNSRDYKAAKKGIASGEEIYTYEEHQNC